MTNLPIFGKFCKSFNCVPCISCKTGSDGDFFCPTSCVILGACRCMFVCTPGSCLVISQDPGSSNTPVCTYEWLSLHLPVCVGSVSRANGLCVSVCACASVCVSVCVGSVSQTNSLIVRMCLCQSRRVCVWVQLCVCPRWVGQSDLRDIVICWRLFPSYHAALPTTWPHVHAWTGRMLGLTSLMYRYQAELCSCVVCFKRYVVLPNRSYGKLSLLEFCSVY